MPTTEIAGYPLIAESDILDPRNNAAIKIKQFVETVLTQDGVRSFYFGMQAERPQMLEAMITYHNMEKHHAWMEHPEYGPTNQRIGSIFAGSGYMYHVDFEPFDNFQRALESPITEVATFYFNGQPPQNYLDAFYAFRKAADEDQDCGLLASAAGITYEDVEHDGNEGKAVVFIAGWRSVEAHKSFKDTEIYKTHIPKLTQWIEKVEARHVPFTHI